MSMRLTVADLEQIAGAVARLKDMPNISVTTFQCANHTLVVERVDSRDDTEYIVRGITSGNLSGNQVCR